MVAVAAVPFLPEQSQLSLLLKSSELLPVEPVLGTTVVLATT
jgi:hypothetical protein